MWQGLLPPQALLTWRRFKKVLLDPPRFEPGSWAGAGKLWLDPLDREFLLTSRPRSWPERGLAIEVYRSSDGENFTLACRLSKEELSDMCGFKVLSIEGTQILRDPLTGRYMLYASLEVGGRWETYLLSSDDPAGPWRGEGFVLRCDRDYDAVEARDPTIDIVDGRYICLYKANAGGLSVRTALAVSEDGRRWVKLGIPRLDGEEQKPYFLLYGSIFAGCTGPVIIGVATREVVKGAHLTDTFAAYVIDYRGLNLERIFEAKWAPGSIYEHPRYPIHGYAGVAQDVERGRWLIWIEAVDPSWSREPGLNEEVDRVLLYESKPPSKSF
ncbi:MAG: hypothetical protein QXM53_04300 [Thermofilaceae archaeon]